MPNTLGKEKVSSQFNGGAIFVDHATRCIFNKHQHSTTTAESILSKHAFEDYSSTHGVKIRECVADNNPFHGKDWTNDCLNQHQQRHFSGVGAHHQNYSERQIQTIFNMSQAMLIHFALHWSHVVDTNLWPFAVDHAIYILNNIPGQEASLRMSPKELFSGIKYQNHNHLQRLHVSGCPVYVLEPKLQDAKKLPKWIRRSHRGIYLGLSKVHSTNVHLVLNLLTGHILPQYHPVFDDHFSTVYSDGEFDADV